MKAKQKIILGSFLVLALSAVSGIFSTRIVHAEPLSYTLECQDGSWKLSTTKQAEKHQVVVKCASGAKFTYMNNSSTAKSRVTGKCPDGENVGSNVDVPNGKSTRLILYCVTGTIEHTTRTNHTPAVATEKYTPPVDDSTDPLAGSDCGGVQTAVIKCDQDNSGGIENNGVWGLLIITLNILTAGVGIVAVGGIVYGSILYTTAEDKADQVKKATDIITNVVIGLIAFALMWALLNFIVPGGAFS